MPRRAFCRGTALAPFAGQSGIASHRLALLPTATRWQEICMGSMQAKHVCMCVRTSSSSSTEGPGRTRAARASRPGHAGMLDGETAWLQACRWSRSPQEPHVNHPVALWAELVEYRDNTVPPASQEGVCRRVISEVPSTHPRTQPIHVWCVRPVNHIIEPAQPVRDSPLRWVVAVVHSNNNHRHLLLSPHFVRVWPSFVISHPLSPAPCLRLHSPSVVGSHSLALP